MEVLAKALQVIFSLGAAIRKTQRESTWPCSEAPHLFAAFIMFVSFMFAVTAHDLLSQSSIGTIATSYYSGSSSSSSSI
jgi:hypothetical protein